MKSNVGQADQIVRGITGAGMIIVTGLGALDGVWKIIAVVVGGIGVFTASAAFCPFYQFLGLNTGSTERTRLTS
ncbi:hypothetical protein BH23GEM9_BH23GEM9_37530 [soil metagenome]